MAVVGCRTAIPRVPQWRLKVRAASRPVIVLPAPVESVTTRMPAPCSRTTGSSWAMTEACSRLGPVVCGWAWVKGTSGRVIRSSPDAVTTSAAHPSSASASAG